MRVEPVKFASLVFKVFRPLYSVPLWLARELCLQLPKKKLRA